MYRYWKGLSVWCHAVTCHACHYLSRRRVAARHVAMAVTSPQLSPAPPALLHPSFFLQVQYISTVQMYRTGYHCTVQIYRTGYHSTVQMYRTGYHSTVQMYRIGYILPAGAVLYVDVVRPRPVDAVSETNTDTVQCGATTFKLAIKMYKCCQLVKFDFSFKKQWICKPFIVTHTRLAQKCTGSEVSPFTIDWESKILDGM